VRVVRSNSKEALETYTRYGYTCQPFFYCQ
jgi:hypothetical protein